MKLAAMMGRVNVDEMLAEMTPRQFEEWFIAYREGILHEDEWLQAGVVAATTHNEFAIVRAMLSKTKLTDKDFADPQDFTPLPKRPKPKTTQPQIRLPGGNSRNH